MLCIYMLTGSVLALHRCNDTAAFRKCLQTTLLYTSNIFNNIDNPKFHCIKLSNKNIQNFVLSLNGGLSFFMCSPIYWQVCFINDNLVCNNALVQACREGAGAGAALRSQWLGMIAAYCAFLADVLQLEEFQVV